MSLDTKQLSRAVAAILATTCLVTSCTTASPAPRLDALPPFPRSAVAKPWTDAQTPPGGWPLFSYPSPEELIGHEIAQFRDGPRHRGTEHIEITGFVIMEDGRPFGYLYYVDPFDEVNAGHEQRLWLTLGEDGWYVSDLMLRVHCVRRIAPEGFCG